MGRTGCRAVFANRRPQIGELLLSQAVNAGERGIIDADILAHNFWRYPRIA